MPPQQPGHQRYRDRRHGGAELASRLQHLKDRDDVVVLALPRGGVPVAYEIARTIQAPLDVFLVRKLGLPGHAELAMGAIASGGVRVLNDHVIRRFDVPPQLIERTTQQEQRELERREREYRIGRAPMSLQGRTVVLIDDGLATGSTMKAAVQAIRAQGPARIIVAVPVGSTEACRELANLADELICARTLERFNAVGQWYSDFSQTTDEEVRNLLRDREHASK